MGAFLTIIFAFNPSHSTKTDKRDLPLEYMSINFNYFDTLFAYVDGFDIEVKRACPCGIPTKLRIKMIKNKSLEKNTDIQ